MKFSGGYRIEQGTGSGTGFRVSPPDDPILSGALSAGTVYNVFDTGDVDGVALAKIFPVSDTNVVHVTQYYDNSASTYKYGVSDSDISDGVITQNTFATLPISDVRIGCFDVTQLSPTKFMSVWTNTNNLRLSSIVFEYDPALNDFTFGSQQTGILTPTVNNSVESLPPAVVGLDNSRCLAIWTEFSDDEIGAAVLSISGT